MKEQAFIIRSINVVSDAWTKLTSPMVCGYCEIINQSTADIALRTDDDCPESEFILKSGASFAIMAPSQRLDNVTALRFRKDITVVYAKLVTDGPPMKLHGFFFI